MALLTDALKNEQEYFMQHGTDDDDGWVMAGWMKEGWMKDEGRSGHMHMCMCGYMDRTDGYIEGYTDR